MANRTGRHTPTCRCWFAWALVLDPEGFAVEVDVFESADLPAHWSRLDEFEGPGYVRVATTVDTASGHIDAFIYVLRSEPMTS